MKKNKLTILIVALLISILITSNVFAYEYEKVGWTNEGKPQYTWSTLNSNGTLKDYSSHLKKSDLSGSTIMKRLRDSYSLKGRASKIKDSVLMQNNLYVPINSQNNLDYTNITYYDSPNGRGYTSWYDSLYGVFIDYTSQFSPEYLGKVVDTTHKNVDIVKDSIDFANIQYSNSNSAYLTTTKRGMGDSRIASMLVRSGENYPIYLNNGENIDDRVKIAMKNKGVKNIYLLGGNQVFNYTAGLTSGFNIIRAGGENREETKKLMMKLPNKVKEPQHFNSDSEGIVMIGVPETYKKIIKNTYLTPEKKAKDSSNLIMAAKFLSNLNIGSEPNQNSNPAMIIGINDGEYEAYWICYWNSSANGYVYQFVLNGYHTDNININSEVTSVETSNTVYKQNNSTYWTKPNSDVNINTRGTVNVKSDMNGVKLHLYNSSYGNNINNSPYHEMTPGTISTNSQFSTSFSNATTQKAVLGTYNNLRAITGKHIIRAKESGKSYLLHTSAQYGFWSNPTSSGIALKTDGIAPVVSGMPSSAWTKENVPFSINATDSQSGVKSVVVKKGDAEIDKNYNETKEGIHSYTATATDNVSNTANNTFTIKIDKTAPIGDPSFEYDEVKGILDVKVDNVVEAGSGVKNIWIELSQENNPENIIKESLNLKEDGTYTITTDVFEKFDDKGKIKVKVKAEDIVGNIGDLGSNDIDVFKVEAIVERVLEPHTPIFKGGEKGILKIKLYGGVDKYRITFPQALSELDDTLNIEKSITPQKTTEIEYEFFIPIDAPKGNYNVTVDGYKKGIKKSAHPGLEVDGTITDRLRTRIRLPQRR